MAVFSKPLSINHTCYELGHCWTPYCRKASTDIAGHVFKEALKIYGTLYLMAGLFKRRGLDYYIKKLIPETLRSSIFLTINGTLFITMFCVWRTMLGCMFLLTASFIPAYIAAFTAVMVERKSRRGPLAVYLTNLAIETGYRMLVERNLVRPIANGEVYLFSAVSAVYLYLFRTQNGLSSSAESLFRFFVGGDENPKRSLTPRSLTDSVGPHQDRRGANNVTSQQRGHPSNGSKAKLVGRTILRRVPLVEGLVREVQGQVTGWVKYLEGLAKHRCCPHEHSCLSYVIKGGTKMFTIGFLVQATLSSVSVINSIIKKPSTLKNTIFNRLNLKLAAFLGGYSAIFRAVNCILRWVRNKDTPVNGFIAGGLAGLTLRFYRSVTIALYAATKLVEILYFKGIESYGFPYIKCADIFIYAFSTAFIFHAAVMEPHTLRPGYWKFLLRVTDNKFALMNRQLLDVFGANSSKIKPDYWPDYDPVFTTLTRPKS